MKNRLDDDQVTRSNITSMSSGILNDVDPKISTYFNTSTHTTDVTSHRSNVPETASLD